jgi:hypothetical protein
MKTRLPINHYPAITDITKVDSVTAIATLGTAFAVAAKPIVSWLMAAGITPRSCVSAWLMNTRVA